MKNMKDYKKAGYLILIVTLLYLAASFIVSLLPIEMDLLQLYAVNALVVSIGAIYVPALLFMRKAGPGSHGRTRVTVPAILWSALLGLGLFQLITGLASAFREGLFALGVESMELSMGLPSSQGWRLLASIVLIAVIPAITEEQLFRGALLQSWRPMGRKKAVLLTAALFALFHLSPFDLPFLFIIGLVLGILAYDSESVYPGMVVHGVNNLMGILLTHAAEQTTSAAAQAEVTTGELWMSICLYIVMGSVITYVSFRQVRRCFVPRPASGGEKDKGVGLPLIITGVLLLLLNFGMLAIQMGWAVM